MSGAAACGSFEVGTTRATRTAAARRYRRHGDEDAGPAEVLQQPAHRRSAPSRWPRRRSRPTVPIARARSLLSVNTFEISDKRRRECHRGAQPHHGPGRDELRRSVVKPPARLAAPNTVSPASSMPLRPPRTGRQAAESEQQRGEDEVERVDDPQQISGWWQCNSRTRAGSATFTRGAVEVDEERCQQQRDEDHGFGSHGASLTATRHWGHPPDGRLSFHGTGLRTKYRRALRHGGLAGRKIRPVHGGLVAGGFCHPNRAMGTAPR